MAFNLGNLFYAVQEYDKQKKYDQERQDRLQQQQFDNGLRQMLADLQRQTTEQSLSHKDQLFPSQLQIAENQAQEGSIRNQWLPTQFELDTESRRFGNVGQDIQNQKGYLELGYYPERLEAEQKARDVATDTARINLDYLVRTLADRTGLARQNFLQAVETAKQKQTESNYLAPRLELQLARDRFNNIIAENQAKLSEGTLADQLAISGANARTANVNADVAEATKDNKIATSQANADSAKTRALVAQATKDLEVQKAINDAKVSEAKTKEIEAKIETGAGLSLKDIAYLYKITTLDPYEAQNRYNYSEEKPEIKTFEQFMAEDLPKIQALSGGGQAQPTDIGPQAQSTAGGDQTTQMISNIEGRFKTKEQALAWLQGEANLDAMRADGIDVDQLLEHFGAGQSKQQDKVQETKDLIKSWSNNNSVNGVDVEEILKYYGKAGYSKGWGW